MMDLFDDYVQRKLVWFSCGAASAVLAKKASEKYGEGLEILYCFVANEHQDNMRFLKDVEKWIGHEIKILKSKDYPSCDIHEVFEKRKYFGRGQSMTCTDWLKRQVRKKYQRQDDIHLMGYTSEEWHRIYNFERDNHVQTDNLLYDLGITKTDCYRIIQQAGIELPTMYKLGYGHNNCLGCVKGGMGYWNKIRKDFPEHFKLMAERERKLKYKLTKKCFLDELPETAGRFDEEPDIECGVQCVMPDETLAKLRGDGGERV